MQLMTPETALTHSPPAPWQRRLAWLAPAFIVAVILSRMLLLLGGTGTTRILLRFGTFAGSLLLLFLLPWRGRRHPSALALLWVMIILGFEFFHPQTNSMLAGMAQWGFYLAILSPLLWVPRLEINQRGMRIALFLLWLFYSLSAGFGVLQMYYPGRFQPTLSPVIASLGPQVQGLMIHLANGKDVFRPMGLTDTPGGAGIAGLWAILFSLGILLSESPYWLRALCLVSISLGLVCIVLSEIRLVMVMLLIILAVLALGLIWRNDWLRLLRWTVLIGLLLGASLSWALSVGGKQTLRRLQSLGQSYHGQNLYEVDRGRFLRQTYKVDLLKYPFGAGMGRWGMMNYYFGVQNNPRSLPLYVEIQWTGWIFDGGIPLTLCYLAAILIAVGAMVKIVASKQSLLRDLRFWAMIVLAYNIACLAATFDYPFFASQSGMMFWFLNAMIFAAWLAQRQRAAQAAPLAMPLPLQPGAWASKLRTVWPL